MDSSRIVRYVKTNWTKGKESKMIRNSVSVPGRKETNISLRRKKRRKWRRAEDEKVGRKNDRIYIYIYVFNGCCMHEGLGRPFSVALPLHTTWSVLILFGGHDEGEASERGDRGERGGQSRSVRNLPSPSFSLSLSLSDIRPPSPQPSNVFLFPFLFLSLSPRGG